MVSGLGQLTGGGTRQQRKLMALGALGTMPSSMGIPPENGKTRLNKKGGSSTGSLKTHRIQEVQDQRTQTTAG